MNKQVEELLPFYVNGTLDEKETALVEKAIQETPSLKDEIDFLEKLRHEVKSYDAGNSPGELGLKRLQKSLAEEKAKSDFISQTIAKAAPAQNNSIWRIVAVAACLMLIVQTAITIPNWTVDEDLTAASGGHNIFLSGKILSVTFVPEASEENLRSLLLAVGARIVDGPSALGVYKIAVTSDMETIVDKLNAHKNLIESVQIESVN